MNHEPCRTITAGQALGGAAVLIGAIAACLQFTQQQALHELLIMNQVSKGFEPSPPPARSGVPPQATFLIWLAAGVAVTALSLLPVAAEEVKQAIERSVTPISIRQRRSTNRSS